MGDDFGPVDLDPVPMEFEPFIVAEEEAGDDAGTMPMDPKP